MGRQTSTHLLIALVACAGLAQPCFAQEESETSAEVEAADSARPATPQPAVAMDDDVEISSMAEALELALLVEFVAEELAIDIAVQGELTGEVTFVAPRTIKRSDLLPLLERLLDQNNFTLTYDALLDRYLIRQSGAISGGSAAGEFATTRIIPPPGLRPSQLQPTVDQYSTAVNGIGSVSYLDELGVIVLTGPPIRAREFEMFIQSILSQAQQLEYTRLPLMHVSAAAARDRIIELLSPRQAAVAVQRGGNNAAAVTGSSTGLLNVTDRLVVDLQSNSLIFRGLPAERAEVAAIVERIEASGRAVEAASMGSSLKFCQVAEGAADLYPRLGRTMEWDTAAGDAVLRAAGGQVLTMDGAALTYGKCWPGEVGDTFATRTLLLAELWTRLSLPEG